MVDDFQPNQLRILVADDEISTSDLFQHALSLEKIDYKLSSEIGELAGRLFGENISSTSVPSFDLVICRQGDKAVDAVKRALRENRPFAVAFLDVMMPPGPDGIWAAEHIRELDPHIEIVIVTGYSDINPRDISLRVPPVHKLLYIQKPFRPQEIYQFASSLGSKWQMEVKLQKAHEELEMRVKERTESLVKANEKLKESENRLRFLSSRLLTAQERERKRISMELHDELGQAMMVLKLHLRSIQKQLGENQKAIKEDFEQSYLYVEGITENIRRISRDLSPSILEDLGLSAALKWLIDDAARHYHIESSVKMDDIQNLFSQEKEIIIFRIFQEALTNIGKHANATNFLITIEKQDSRVLFIVEDGGKGFDVKRLFAENATERGLGLSAMHERARMLEGSLDIWSQENKGTRITLICPINEGQNK